MLNYLKVKKKLKNMKPLKQFESCMFEAFAITSLSHQVDIKIIYYAHYMLVFIILTRIEKHVGCFN